ncbi:MAG: RNA methyltransferase, partial [bacterium]
MIVVVLHEPQDLVNIAHVVRAMKNFGFKDLRLVSPREYDGYRVEGIAHQTADIVARVRRFETLAQALADCVHVVGFTARGRTAKRNVQRPREAAAEVIALEGDGGERPTALLFGREDRGLSNEALDRCHRVVTIPAEPSYSSLNLGHAVMLMLYELALARGAEALPFKAPRRPTEPVPAEDLERLFADVARALATIEFFKTRNQEGIMRTMRE